MRRQARGLPLLEALEEKEERDHGKNDKAAQDDPVLIESSNILVDLTTLIDQPSGDEPVVQAH